VVIDPKSGSSKGFGFIEMPNVSEAQGAIKNLNYKTVGRNKIRVKTTKN
jgi:RNA recognition motif-containing protein